MKKVMFFAGLAVALLGTLWLLQGLGLIHIRPILCFANCAPIQEASTTWAIAGAVALTVGGAVMFWCFERRAALGPMK